MKTHLAPSPFPNSRFSTSGPEWESDYPKSGEKLADAALGLINSSCEHFSIDAKDALLHVLIGIQERVNNGSNLPMTLRECASLATVLRELK